MPRTSSGVGSSILRSNERSWAIDVIGCINKMVLQGQVIQRAGGEYSMRDMDGTLFPDVMLFGSSETGVILHGWELKLPDTPVSDSDLLTNSARKAKGIGADSFLVWNFNEAVLYSASADTALGFAPVHSWLIEGELATRDTVENKREAWQSMLADILASLETYFADGKITPVSVAGIMASGALYDAISASSAALSEHIQKRMDADASVKAEIDLWWNASKEEYGSKNDSEKVGVFARTLLTSWFNKILFCHILKRYYSEAKAIENVDGTYTQEDASRTLDEISRTCDFMNILHPSEGFSSLGDAAWKSIVELNVFLSSCSFEKLDSEILGSILSSTISLARRKVAGQYSTPEKLAELVVKSSLIKNDWMFIDPCCGTGTIPRAVYMEKCSRGITGKKALSQVWASDKFSFPVSITTMGVTFPENIGEVVRVFRSDAADIKVDREVTFRNPSTGKDEEHSLPMFQCIISNFPFIRNEQARVLNSNVLESTSLILGALGENRSLDNKSDLYAHLPFHLWKILAPEGKLSFIASNSWLGTNWGKTFFTLLRRFFRVEKVLMSGNGRWFENADVVTTVLILERRGDPLSEENSESGECTDFILLRKKLGECDSETINLASSAVIAGQGVDELCSVRKMTVKDMKDTHDAGLNMNSFFFNVMPAVNTGKIKRDNESILLPAKNVFDFFRGARRGWNDLFYPGANSGIEQQYLGPVLKKSETVRGLVASPDTTGFFCGSTMADLVRLGHTGAVAHINRFVQARNGTGKLLPSVLATNGLHWYEMRRGIKPDIVALMNYDKRLFFPATPGVDFIDQRFIGMSLSNQTRGKQVSVSLCHALLNSFLGLFYIEALGFGRGLGVLDLSKDRMEEGLFMLNPFVLSSQETQDILNAFGPLKQRHVMSLKDELQSSDRIDFDSRVAAVYGIPDDTVKKVRDSLLDMHNARLSVLQ